jgi:hypothetical protein
MKTRPLVLAALFVGGGLLTGCKAREGAAPVVQTPAAPSSGQPATPFIAEVAATPAEATPATPANSRPSPAQVRETVPTKSARSPSSSPAPNQTASASSVREVATARPAPLSPAAAPATQPPSGSKVEDPGGSIAVAATKTGLTRIGADKCRICHKIQFASWVETAHARRTPPLECESCHGPGSEYKAPAIMKDPEKAKAAGLVIPSAAFCANCHKRGWNDDMLKKAHAHKASSGS